MRQLHPHHKKKIALWVAVGGIMTLVVAMWAVLLPTQLRDANLFGSLDRWQVYRPSTKELSEGWSETMDKWKVLMNDAQAQSDLQTANERPRVTESDVDKLKGRIEAAGSRNEAEPETTP